MAPEVMLRQPYNEKADIFSLACCITEVSTICAPPPCVFSGFVVERS